MEEKKIESKVNNDETEAKLALFYDLMMLSKISFVCYTKDRVPVLTVIYNVKQEASEERIILVQVGSLEITINRWQPCVHGFQDFLRILNKACNLITRQVVKCKHCSHISLYPICKSCRSHLIVPIFDTCITCRDDEHPIAWMCKTCVDSKYCTTCCQIWMELHDQEELKCPTCKLTNPLNQSQLELTIEPTSYSEEDVKQMLMLSPLQRVLNIIHFAEETNIISVSHDYVKELETLPFYDLQLLCQDIANQNLIVYLQPLPAREWNMYIIMNDEGHQSFKQQHSLNINEYHYFFREEEPKE